jgi:predicted transcriptional regulator
MKKDVARATSLLGPLEARIMRAVWSGHVPAEFVVRDALKVIPELAYTTLMTTVQRLAVKGLLIATQRGKDRAYRYRAAGTPADYIADATRSQVRELVDRFGDSALAAFAAELGGVSDRDLERLRKLRRR